MTAAVPAGELWLAADGFGDLTNALKRLGFYRLPTKQSVGDTAAMPFTPAAKLPNMSELIIARHRAPKRVTVAPARVPGLYLLRGIAAPRQCERPDRSCFPGGVTRTLPPTDTAVWAK
ncbi:hypothetical protein AAL_05694 [Moelleriella libera RCEF 2490]|uniref:Uncharacterized protein n=1 Tax=Moelleriella libera RCEF 2490 TaxID=1081109 RepID=A0A168A0C7_9HYPO|nr:hypothetical protein AAL_05694 [Moelleriella libera RCEF 2490]